MRVGVISDTHLEPRDDFSALGELISRVLAPIDLLVHAGDVTCLPALEFFHGQYHIEAVAGNMDSPSVARILPSKKVLLLKQFRVGLIHGAGPKLDIVTRIGSEFENVDCIVFGHTHEVFNEYRDGVLFFNPGSPTGTSSKATSLGLLEIGTTVKPRIFTI